MRGRRVVLVGLVGLASACSTATAPSAPPAPGCAGDVAPAPLPDWARTGFHPPDQPVPYVTGARGEIVGVLFGLPLTAPPAPDRGNKILWIPRDLPPAGPLTITAMADGGAVVTRTIVEGPGPSLVDMPSAGCWRLALTWPAHSDEVVVAYRPG